MTPALLINRSSRSWPARNSAAKLRIEARLARSSAITSRSAWGTALRISRAALPPLAVLRTASATCAPRMASSLAAS